MKRLFAAMTAALMVLALTGTAIAAPKSSTLTCDGNCTISGTTATITTNGTLGDGGSVWYTKFSGKSFYGQRLSQISALSFTSSGSSALGIDPRWSIPIDTNNDGFTEAFAFVASGTCNNGAGLVDVIHDATCSVNYLGATYANWAAFVAAQPAIAEISLTDNWAFVVADGSGGVAGSWTIGNLKVGSTK
jgi:hypothetical protein